MCLATHAGDVPSAGKDVGNHTGTFNSTFFSAYDGLASNVNDSASAKHRIDSDFLITKPHPSWNRDVWRNARLFKPFIFTLAVTDYTKILP